MTRCSDLLIAAVILHNVHGLGSSNQALSWMLDPGLLSPLMSILDELK